MIKRLEEGFYVIDEDGHTDEKNSGKNQRNYRSVKRNDA